MNNFDNDHCLHKLPCGLCSMMKIQCPKQASEKQIRWQTNTTSTLKEPSKNYSIKVIGGEQE